MNPPEKEEGVPPSSSPSSVSAPLSFAVAIANGLCSGGGGASADAEKSIVGLASAMVPDLDITPMMKMMTTSTAIAICLWWV